MSELPQPLDEVLSTALEHGVQSVAHGGPLLPFGIVDHGDGLELHRFHAGDGDLVESQAAGRTWLRRQQGLRRACIAWTCACARPSRGAREAHAQPAVCAFSGVTDDLTFRWP